MLPRGRAEGCEPAGEMGLGILVGDGWGGDFDGFGDFGAELGGVVGRVESVPSCLWRVDKRPSPNGLLRR